MLEHTEGALSILMMSFDIWDAQLPRIEIYGTAGSLALPDPNGFHGAVRIFRPDRPEWTDVPERGGYRGAARGYGVADMARAIAEGTAPRQPAANSPTTSWT